MPRRRNGAGVHGGKRSCRREVADPPGRVQKPFDTHRPQGSRPAPARRNVFRSRGRQSIEPVLTDQRGLVNDEIERGCPGLIGAAEELEENAQSCPLIFGLSDRGTRLGHGERLCGRHEMVGGFEVGARTLAQGDRLDRLRGVAADPVNVAARQDSASARRAHAPMARRAFHRPQIARPHQRQHTSELLVCQLVPVLPSVGLGTELLRAVGIEPRRRGLAIVWGHRR